MRSEVSRGRYAVEVAFEFQIDGVRCRSQGIYIHRINFSPSCPVRSLFNLDVVLPEGDQLCSVALLRREDDGRKQFSLWRCSYVTQRQAGKREMVAEAAQRGAVNVRGETLMWGLRIVDRRIQCSRQCLGHKSPSGAHPIVYR